VLGAAGAHAEIIERIIVKVNGEIITLSEFQERQILVETLNEARDLKRRLYRDSRSFETLAGTRSKGPEAAVGGYMGTFERGQLPEALEEVAFRLTPGRTSQPVQTSLGYHVLRVDSRQPARELPLEEARGWIRERLTRERADAAARAFVAGLLSRATSS
jgi:parvulin-like peptidyl-prolyl isomerase